MSGYVNEAHELSKSLLSPGPWEVNKFTGQLDELKRLHPVICWLCDTDCQSIGDDDGLSKSQVRDEACSHWNDQLDSLIVSDRMQLHEVGYNWDENYFARLDELVLQHGKSIDYGYFIDDIDWVLKYRLREKSKRKVPSILPPFLLALVPYLKIKKKIRLHDNTKNYDSHWLTDKHEASCNKYSEALGHKHIAYSEVNAYKMQLIMDLLDGDLTSVKVQVRRLMDAEDRFDLLEMCYSTEFKDLVLAGHFREIVGVSADHVKEYVTQFRTRKSQKKSIPNATEAGDSAVNIEAFLSICEETKLADNEFFDTPVPLSKEKVIFAEVDNKDALSLWRSARSLINETGRWPVLAFGWGASVEEILDRESFQRELFDGDRTGLSAKDIVSGSNYINLYDTYRKRADESYENISEYLSYQLIEEADQDMIDEAILELDHSRNDIYAKAYSNLFNLQCEKYGQPAANDMHLEWFEPDENDQQYLLLLPTEHSWQVPAYLHWYGSEGVGSELTTAQLKQWHDLYGADVVAHYGTMLHFVAKKRPGSIDAALLLAFEQDMLASCTLALPGVSIGEHAMALMSSDKWFIHERP